MRFFVVFFFWGGGAVGGVGEGYLRDNVLLVALFPSAPHQLCDHLVGESWLPFFCENPRKHVSRDGQ